MNALSTEQFRKQIHQIPARSEAILAQLRQQSARPEDVRADPLVLPGGAPAEEAWHDRERARRRELKVLLAGNKLHAGLVAAALNRPPADREAGALDGGVPDFVERAGRWIETVTDALGRRWAALDTSSDPKPPALSPYHRYDIARTLVDVLQRQPTAADIDPERMAEYLTAAAPALAPEPPASAWIPAGEDVDYRLGWSRALARVAEAAAAHNFNREIPVLLADARTAITTEAQRGCEAVAGGLELNAETARIVYLHALNTASRLYAATLKAVYEESVRQIQVHQCWVERGNEAEADRCAQAYQDRHLGYAGVGHHFERCMAACRQQQADAREALRPDLTLPEAAPASKGPAASPQAVSRVAAPGSN